MATEFDLCDPGPAANAFLSEGHLATLTTTGLRGRPQVTPVGFTYDATSGLARVITWAASQKAINVARRPGCTVALCQLDGGRWLTLTGEAVLTIEPAAVDEAVRRYAQRYRSPADRPDRVAIEISVTRMIGRA